MSDWTTVAGVRLETLERGRGRPILWLHGEEGLDPDAPVLDALAAHGRVLAPSHPGYGHSPEAADVDTVDDLAYLYLDWLAQLDARDAVVVGCDRVAANGDVANKIGTYTLAVLARRHGIPFYVAGPTSSIDLECSSGSEIPIEERNPKEVSHMFGKPLAPRGIRVFNPAFDVTDKDLISAIITEKGVIHPPYKRNLRNHVGH